MAGARLRWGVSAPTAASRGEGQVGENRHPDPGVCMRSHLVPARRTKKCSRVQETGNSAGMKKSIFIVSCGFDPQRQEPFAWGALQFYTFCDITITRQKRAAYVVYKIAKSHYSTIKSLTISYSIFIYGTVQTWGGGFWGLQSLYLKTMLSCLHMDFHFLILLS